MQTLEWLIINEQEHMMNKMTWNSISLGIRGKSEDIPMNVLPACFLRILFILIGVPVECDTMLSLPDTNSSNLDLREMLVIFMTDHSH
jgi:hypothetical protein